MPRKGIKIKYNEDSPAKRPKVVDAADEGEPREQEAPPEKAPTKKTTSVTLKKALNLPLPPHYDELRKQFTVLNTTGGFLQSKGVAVTSNRLQSMGITFSPQELCQMAEVAPQAVTLTRAADGDIQCEFLNCGKQASLLSSGPLAIKRATERRENYFRVRLEEETERWACESLGKKTVRKGSKWVDAVKLESAPRIRELDIPSEVTEPSTLNPKP